VRGRASRFRPFSRLKAVDPPPQSQAEEEPPRPVAAPASPSGEPTAHSSRGDVAPLGRGRSATREWNLWELERLAHAGAERHTERSQEWAYLFVHLRQFANPDGALPPEFDGLVRESFGELLDAPGRA
jgi:hypothetical protein